MEFCRRLICSRKRKKTVNDTKLKDTNPPISAIPEKPFPFMRLPLEIRQQVYKEVLTRDDHGEIWIKYSVDRNEWWDATSFCRCNGKTDWFLPTTDLHCHLLYTCKAIHDEASQVLYGINNIWVDAPPGQILHFLSHLPPVSLRSIRHLKFWLDPYPDCSDRLAPWDELPQRELILLQRRMQEELFEKWCAVFAFLSKNVDQLHTLTIRLPPNPLYHAKRIQGLSEDWYRFLTYGWMEKLRDISCITTLIIEARKFGPEPPDSEELELLNELRKVVQETLQFSEEHVGWNHYLSAAGGMDAGIWPSSHLHLVLKRVDVLPAFSLSPFPEFVQRFTYADARSIPICTMGTGGPPRSPNNNH